MKQTASLNRAQRTRTLRPLSGQGSASTLRLRHLMEERQRLEIGERIKELRNASPQTNRSIGDFVGVGERAVANWIAGGGIAWENAKKVAELFQVDPQWLWSGREAGPAPDLLAEMAADIKDILSRLDAQGAVQAATAQLEGDSQERRRTDPERGEAESAGGAKPPSE